MKRLRPRDNWKTEPEHRLGDAKSKTGDRCVKSNERSPADRVKNSEYPSKGSACFDKRCALLRPLYGATFPMKLRGTPLFFVTWQELEANRQVYGHADEK